MRTRLATSETPASLPPLPTPSSGKRIVGAPRTGEQPRATALSETQASDAPPARSAALATGAPHRRPAPVRLIATGALVVAAAVILIFAIRPSDRAEHAAKEPATATVSVGAPSTGTTPGAAAAPGTAAASGAAAPGTAAHEMVGHGAAGARAAVPEAAPGAANEAAIEAANDAANDAAAPHAGAGAPEARPANVFVTIEGVPPNTKVLRDGVVIGTAPGRVPLARGGAEVTLVVSADGFAAATLVVTPTSDLSRTVKLTPKAISARPPARPPAPPRAGSAAKPGSDEPTNDIEQFPKP